MLNRRLDENHDPVFGGGKYDYMKDIDAVAQAIITKIKLLKGEFWEDVQDGTPFFQQITGQKMFNNNLAAIDILLKERILNVPNVQSIKSFKSSIDAKSRKYEAIMNVETTFGDIENMEVII